MYLLRKGMIVIIPCRNLLFRRNFFTFENLQTMKTTCPVAHAPAFEELYTQYRAAFVAVALRYVQNRMVAEDIVSDCFVTYWENRNGQVVEHIPSYILTAVRNRCLDWLRSQLRHAQAHTDIQSAETRLMRQHVATLEANMPRTIFMTEVSEIIRRELLRMPERTRKVFVAHKFEAMTYAEIAQLYGLSQGQVQSDLRAASRQLRTALKDYAPLLTFLTLLH